jgi:FolB domain-containing protein
MSDIIEIKDLLVRTIVGINADEREHRQDVIINIRMWTDLTRAAVSDNIADTVNYRTVCKQVIEKVESTSYFLVERLAAEVVEICFRQPQVQQVQVNVEKPGALRFARSVGVTLQRSRGSFPAPDSAC